MFNNYEQKKKKKRMAKYKIILSYAPQNLRPTLIGNDIRQKYVGGIGR